MVLRFPSCSPRRSGLFVTVVCASSRRLDAGVEASEPHDFAVQHVSSSALTASTASRPASVTIASRPSEGRDRIAILLILPRRQAKLRKFRNRPDRYSGNSRLQKLTGTAWLPRCPRRPANPKISLPSLQPVL